MNFEGKIRRSIIGMLDEFFDELSDNNFKYLNEYKDVSEKEGEEIESIFMSYRNIIAGTEWDGETREYEKYKVKNENNQ